MSAIWKNDASGWRLLSASGFPSEAALHDLVEEAPHVLPLAGSPQLVVVGREVLLGGNYADLLAVEPTGRLAVIEIKLAKSAEARRAVVAQVLTYAAYLRGMDVATLEQDILGSHLRKRDYKGLADAAAANDQQGSFEPTSFVEELGLSLSDGRFRLVLVLDEAPEELVRLVGYLGAVAQKLLIDLVTVAAYDIEGSQVVVPQRVDPERPTPTLRSAPTSPRVAKGRYVEGAEDFELAIATMPGEEQPGLRRLTAWARDLENEGLARLGTFHGASGGLTLLPRLPTDKVGLVTIWNWRGGFLQFWRSVFIRRAPTSLQRVEEIVAPAKVGQGTWTGDINDALLSELTEAYREAATGRVVMPQSPETPAKLN